MENLEIVNFLKFSNFAKFRKIKTLIILLIMTSNALPKPMKVGQTKSMLDICNVHFSNHVNQSYFCVYLSPWTQDVNWTCIRRSENVLDIFWTSYVRSMYGLVLPVSKSIAKQIIFLINYAIVFEGAHPFGTDTKCPKKLTFLTQWYAHLRVRIKG